MFFTAILPFVPLLGQRSLQGCGSVLPKKYTDKLKRWPSNRMRTTGASLGMLSFLADFWTGLCCWLQILCLAKQMSVRAFWAGRLEGRRPPQFRSRSMYWSLSRVVRKLIAILLSLARAALVVLVCSAGCLPLLTFIEGLANFILSCREALLAVACSHVNYGI